MLKQRNTKVKSMANTCGNTASIRYDTIRYDRRV